MTRSASAASAPFAWVDQALAELEAAGLRRRLAHRVEPAGPRVNGLTSFASNDYLGLAGDARVAAAAGEAAQRWGAGAGASRLITGGTGLHRQLELTLAGWKRCEDAVVFSSGYLANIGTITALAGLGDAIFSDALNHASIIDACRLSGAAVRVYPHRDSAALAQLLASTPARRRLIVTDGVFSMDGDAADLPALLAAAEPHGAMVVVDDAHGCGVLGPDGRGTAAAQGCDDAPALLTVGTLSKAFGAGGGYVAGPAVVCEWLRNRARSFVFDTAAPPPTIGAALAALELSVAEPWRRTAATNAALALWEALGGLGSDTPPAACVVPVVLGDASDALRAAAALRDAGVHVVAIRPPSVPHGTARLRFATTAEHTPEDVTRAAAAVTALCTPPNAPIFLG